MPGGFKCPPGISLNKMLTLYTLCLNDDCNNIEKYELEELEIKQWLEDIEYYICPLCESISVPFDTYLSLKEYLNEYNRS